MDFRRSTGGYSGSLGKAAQIIRRGGLVAYPTESCYGIGCDPLNARAVRRLLSLKQRPGHKGLILIASNTRQLQPYVSVIDKKVLVTWPGPVTWLLPSKKMFQTGSGASTRISQFVLAPIKLPTTFVGQPVLPLFRPVPTYRAPYPCAPTGR